MYELLAQTSPSIAATQPTGVEAPIAGAASTGTAQTTAQTSVPGTAKPAPPTLFTMIQSMGPIIIMVVAFFFLMNRSKKKQEKGRTDMLTKLKKGDEVQTIGGILGKVMEARDDKVLVKVDENSNTKIWFSRSAIHRVAGSEDEVK